MRITRLAIAAGLTSLLALAAIAPAAAYSTTSGDAVADFATGFTSTSGSSGVGPVGLAFDATNHLYVMEYTTGFLYKFGTSGGQAGTSTRVNSIAIQGTPAGIAFSKDGRLYAALQGSGSVVEINPTTGVQLRIVATDITQPHGIAP